MQGDQPIAESAEPKIAACVVYENADFVVENSLPVLFLGLPLLESESVNLIRLYCTLYLLASCQWVPEHDRSQQTTNATFAYCRSCQAVGLAWDFRGD
jgi:hypothetical protein